MGCRPDQLYYNSITETWLCNGKPVSEEMVEVSRLVIDFVEKLRLPRDEIYDKFLEQYEVIEDMVTLYPKKTPKIVALGFIAFNSQVGFKVIGEKLGIRWELVSYAYKRYFKTLASAGLLE